jgi:hypothetical protein
MYTDADNDSVMGLRLPTLSACPTTRYTRARTRSDTIPDIACFRRAFLVLARPACSSGIGRRRAVGEARLGHTHCSTQAAAARQTRGLRAQLAGNSVAKVAARGRTAREGSHRPCPCRLAVALCRRPARRSARLCSRPERGGQRGRRRHVGRVMGPHVMGSASWCCATASSFEVFSNIRQQMPLMALADQLQLCSMFRLPRRGPKILVCLWTDLGIIVLVVV